MLITIGKEEEEALDLYVPTISKQRLQAPGAEIGKSRHELVDLMETFARRQFIQEFKQGALRCGEGEGPVPLAPGLHEETGFAGRLVSTLGARQRTVDAMEGLGDSLFTE